MAQDNDISSIDFNVSIEERIKRLKPVNTDILESIRQDLYPDEEIAKKYSRGLNLNTGLGIDH